MKLLTFTDFGGGQYRVHHYNGVIVGDLLKGDDGYYVWWPIPDRHGYIPEHVLRELADKLQELNEDWDNIIQSDPNI